MNKKKILSSFITLALVLSVGACSNEGEEGNSLDGEGTEESSTEELHSDTDPEELINYTINFVFTGNAIPDYATVYIIGDWDNFNEFIALSKKGDDIFSHTFEYITEGTYKYKGVMWYSNENVSWDNCVEIITAENGKDNATLKVSASDGGSQTITTELTAYLESPLTDDEIIELIFESASKVNEDGLTSSWSALHAEVTSDSYETKDSIYLTSQSEFAYGQWHSEYYSQETTIDKYYTNGNIYEHEICNSSETETYTTYESIDTYQSLYENNLDFCEVFEVAEGIVDNQDNNESLEENLAGYTISLEKGGTYELTISNSDENSTYTYSYIDDSNFNLIGFSYLNTDASDGKKYTAEKNTFNDIENVMAGFDSKYWNPLYQGADATNPAELVEKAALTENYSVQIKYDTYTSNSTITSEEYDLAMSGDEDALEKYYALENDVSLTASYILDVYYMDDCMYVVEKIFDEDDYYNLMIVVVVNAEDGLWEYWTSNGTSWSYYSADMYRSLGVTRWQQAFYSLNDAYETGLLNNLEYNSEYEAYDFNDWTFSWYYGYQSVSAAYWFCFLGGDWLFDAYAYYEAYYNFVHYFTYFSEEYQELMAWYCYPYLTYTDYSYSEICFVEEDIYMTVYDVDNTDMRDICYYYHNGLQQSINGSN